MKVYADRTDGTIEDFILLIIGWAYLFDLAYYKNHPRQYDPSLMNKGIEMAHWIQR